MRLFCGGPPALEGQKPVFVPLLSSRAEIPPAGAAPPVAGKEILWSDDPNRSLSFPLSRNPGPSGRSQPRGRETLRLAIYAAQKLAPPLFSSPNRAANPAKPLLSRPGEPSQAQRTFDVGESSRGGGESEERVSKALNQKKPEFRVFSFSVFRRIARRPNPAIGPRWAPRFGVPLRPCSPGRF